MARPVRANGAWNGGEQGNSRRRFCVKAGEVGAVSRVCRGKWGRNMEASFCFLYNIYLYQKVFDLYDNLVFVYK